MQKRIVSLLIVLTMALSSVLVGCGAKENNTDTQPKSSVESSTKTSDEQPVSSSEEKVELEPVTLTMWIGAKETEDSGLIEDSVNEYLKDVLPNTTVDFVWVPTGEYKERWSKAMAAREVVDLAWFGWMLKMETEVAMGSLMPLDDLLQEYGQGIVDTLGQDAIDLHRASDGKSYFCVSWQGLLDGGWAYMMPAENVALMEEGWLEDFQAALYETCDDNCNEVDTWKETLTYLDDYLATLKENDKLGHGISFNNYQSVKPIIRPAQQSYDGVGYQIILVDDTYEIYKTNNKKSNSYKIEAVHHDFYEKGYFPEDIVSMGRTSQAIKNYPDGVCFESFRGLVPSAEAKAEVSQAMDLDVIFALSEAWKSPAFDTGSVIPSTASNPERAMMLLNLLYTDAELYRLIVHGIEGVHYTKNADGTITLPAKEERTYTGPYNWQIGTCVNCYVTAPSNLTYYQELAELEKNSPIYDFVGFAIDESNISVEVANLKALDKEYEMIFAYDNFEELWDEYSKKREEAGLDKVFNEVVKQLEAYAQKMGRKVKVVDLEAL